MAGDLEYNTSTLGILAQRLSTITSNLKGDSDLKDYSRDDVDSDEVASAIDDFVNDWDDKRKKLTNKIETLSVAADESFKKYSDADKKLAESLKSE